MSAAKESDVWVLVGKDGRTHILPQGMIFIGREECEIILQAVSADKRHAVVYFNAEEKEYLIKDLNSLTGTYVNGIRIPEQTYVKLKHLDCIRFGYGPDVFYLEKSACSPRLTVLEKDSNTAKLCKEESLRDCKGLKNSTKSSSPLHKTENQPFNRTDLPPDSLPLNLNNHEDNAKSWCETEGNLSDSPDYSQRSESSSCSAPANVGRSAYADHDASSTHSSPAAMAFTVAFENEVTTPRKKLGIRDSIRKFAPNKPEGESSKLPLQKNCKMEPSPKKLSSEELKSTVLPAVRPPANNICQEQNENTKIQESTAFLIKKMLNTQSSGSISENGVDSDKNEPQVPLLNDANDDRSEAGTYTIEDVNDCDVEEARKKIDEVFGVIQLSNQVPLTQQPANTVAATSTKQIPCLSGRMKQSLNKNCMPNKQRVSCEPEPSQLWGRTNKGVSRGGKRLIPVPSNADVSMCGDRPPVENNSLTRIRRTSDPPPTPERMRRAKLATSPKSTTKGKTISTLKSTGIPTNNLSALPVEKNATIASDDSSHHRSSDNRSEGSKSPHSASGQWRKVPWNLSGSDAELDQSKSENNSVISDTSTEPSSHSSHSGKNKPDHGPQMRLNRAFALRRARLEADSAKRGKENKVLTGSQKAMKKSSKLSASTTALREEGSCSGKTNYRLTAAIAKPVPGKSGVRGADARAEAFRRKPELKSHRRIESDPGKGIPVWRMDSRPATVGSSFINSCHRGSLKAPTYSPDVNNLQSFHRSMSCSVMNDADVPIPNIPCSFVRSFEHSIISGSQIVTGQNIDDFHTRKHPNKELTALDCLVISAVHQLSSKLWTNSKALLEKEREKCSKGSDSWLMIEEVLPNVPVTETPEDGDLTKDLSNILKNLKRVEQGLEVLSCVLDSDTIAESNAVETKPSLPQNFFIVDM